MYNNKKAAEWFSRKNGQGNRQNEVDWKFYTSSNLLHSNSGYKKVHGIFVPEKA